MSSKKRNDSFILQAGILAMAGIFSRIIGILYRSPLAHIIGNEGNGYYGAAINIYTIILLISSYSIPSAISKVIAQRLAVREYKNAHRIFHCALIYVIVVGGIASLLAFFGAGFLVEKNSVIVLRVFAPTIFFSGLLGVLRGYFQGHKNMLQTSISQIFEQIINAVVSVAAAYLLIQMVKDKDSTTQAIYGAIGSAMGTGMGVLLALVFMFSIYMLNQKTIHRRIRHDRSRELLSYRAIFIIILSIVTPFILSTFVYNLSTSLNQTIYTKIMMYVKHVSEVETATLYGIYSGQPVTISNIPIAIASAVSAAMIPTISGLYARGDHRGCSDKVSEAIHTTMLVAIPSMAGLFALAEPVTKLLFNIESSIALSASLLRVLSVTVVFYSLSTLTNAVLQGIGRVNIPVVNAAVALVVQTIVISLLMYYTDLGLYAIAIAAICYSLTMCILNGVCVASSLRYRQDYVKTFLLPLAASLIMGACTFGVYKGVYALTCNVAGVSDVIGNVAGLAVSIPIAALLYFVLILRLGGVTGEDLQRLPKGDRLVGIARKMRLVR
ncbi:MAG: polysaccharide biosynthesis protein [Lachnospiraceae bacterium]|nr:polysaccharide biosynthesis protein [Lachnospiraceae bacterium]